MTDGHFERGPIPDDGVDTEFPASAEDNLLAGPAQGEGFNNLLGERYME